MTMPDAVAQQRIAAYARIVREDAILLTRISNRGYHAGYWTLPGGGVEHGEHPRDAVVREVYEETGLRARVGTLLDVHHVRLPGAIHRGRSEDYHGIHLVFEVAADDAATRVVESDGTTDAVVWVPVDRLPDQPVLDLVRFAASL